MREYLFYNVYGDADDLVATAPENIECIPFGWTPEIEAAREAKIAEIGIGVSSLPSYIYWRPESTRVIEWRVDPERQQIYFLDEPESEIVPAGYRECRIDSLPRPWNWQDIQDWVKIYG